MLPTYFPLKFNLFTRKLNGIRHSVSILFPLISGALIICLIFRDQEENRISYHNSLSSASDVRILCYIPLEVDKLQIAQLIADTWGSKCDKLLFFTGLSSNSNFRDAAQKQLNIIKVNATEDYAKLWGKTKAVLLHMYTHYVKEFNWFLKADLDTFVVMENLRQFIRDRDVEDFSKNEQPIWFGYKMKHRKMQDGYMSGGAGYVMNALALSEFANLVKKNKKRDVVRFDPTVMERPEGCKTKTDEGIEDLELGRCFHYLGIKDWPTQDVKGRHRFLPVSMEKLMAGKISRVHWLRRQSWIPIKIGHPDCCSRDLISIHEVTPNKMRLLHFLVYELTQPNF